MRGPEDGQAWGFIAAARFDADEAVLDDINPADAVSAGKIVCGKEDLKSAAGRLGSSDQFNWNSLGEDNCEVFRGVRGGSHGGGEFPHVVRWSCVGILKDACFVGAMSEILVHTPWLGFGGGNGDLLLSGIVEEIVTASETVIKFRQPPGCNDFNGWLEGIESELWKIKTFFSVINVSSLICTYLKPDLIVSFPRAAM